MFRPCSSFVCSVVAIAAVTACSTGASIVTHNDGGAGSPSVSHGGGGESGGTSGIEGAGAPGGAAGIGAAGAVASGSQPDAAPPMDAPGSVDSRSDQQAPETGTSACAGLFCEDFEQGQLDPEKWDTQMGGSGVAMVQQQTVAHGKYALHVQDTGTAGDFATILTKDVPTTLQGAGPIFGRVYLNTAMSIGGTHIQLGFAGTTRDPNVSPAIMTKNINFNYMEFAYFANSWQLGFDLFTPAPSVAKGFVEEASYPPARDKYPVATWSCIEWEFGDDPDTMVLWVDGKQMAQLNAQHIDYSSVAKMSGSVLNGLSSGIIGGFSFYGLGIHNWGASTTVDTYYDDLVLDTKRVGCIP